MDNPEAAHLLGVAEAEVRDVKAEAGWWHALHHDMASHQEEWRRVIQAQEQEASPDTFPHPVEESHGTKWGTDVLDAVPDGTIQEVLDWVGEDRERALAAQVVEQEKESPRSTLLAALEKISH